MVTNDPYGISGAVRPWDSLDAARRPCRRVPTAKQAEIDRKNATGHAEMGYRLLGPRG